MNTEAAKTAIDKFNKEQINKTNFVKESSNRIIEDLESEILKLKEQLKKHKAIIKQANKDISNYSL